MKGYIFNSLLVAGGSILGLMAGKRIHEDTKDTIFNVLGLVTVIVGLTMSLNGRDIIPIVFCLVLGTFAGTALRIEGRVNDLLNRLNTSYLSGKYNVEGFLVASTLFCVGSMTIIGSLKDGLYNDATLIQTKSVMDAFAAFLLASRYGLPVLFSAVTVFAFQCVLTLFSKNLTFLTAERMMNNIDGVGGIIVVAIGLNLLKLKTMMTIDMLPALVLIVLYGLWR
ncbi:MAG: hypothetical protein A2X56_08585 [Nitrospirae bacterium GWC2_57_13]|jgi:uncharacterized protein|nr:MAG: hypothetical protein A2X56_08585 [Nitrospirae bacterium GWC2_57_13]HAR46087.1 DUF554 domain-containing protein [Nitrospiraceae bacterium]